MASFNPEIVWLSSDFWWILLQKHHLHHGRKVFCYNFINIWPSELFWFWSFLGNIRFEETWYDFLKFILQWFPSPSIILDKIYLNEKKIISAAAAKRERRRRGDKNYLDIHESLYFHTQAETMREVFLLESLSTCAVCVGLESPKILNYSCKWSWPMTLMDYHPRIA